MSQHYQPLDASKQEIRVLWLLPPTKQDAASSQPEPEPEIQATLNTISLTQSPAYNALSYTWGSPTDPVPQIQLNGRPFAVRSNLHDCLIHLRQRGLGSPESGIPLWIDAVCIDQDDIPEKNSQLPLLGAIYRRAACVISWLGSDERLVRGVGTVTEIGREWTRFRVEELGLGETDCRVAVPQIGRRHGGRREEYPRDRVEGWLRETGKIWQAEDAGFSGMIDLFHSEYWRRVWITQELLLANPETHIYICGTASMAEADLDKLCDCILTVFGDGENVEGVDDQVWTNISLGILDELAMRAWLSDIQRGYASPSLMFVLYASGTRSATDPRDVVYGLLSLVRDHDIIPDYGKPVWEVYTEWAAKAMLEQGRMDLLSYVTAKEQHRTNVELEGVPSWVPDVCNYKGYRFVNWVKKQNAHGCPDGGFSVELRNNGRVLKVEGRRFDTVKKATQLRRLAESRGEWGWDMVRFCMDFMVAQRESGRQYPTGIPSLQALLRLAMRSRIEALSADEYPKRIHEEAAGFLSWLVTGFANMFRGRVNVPQWEPLELAASLLGLSWDDDFPETYQEMVFPGVDVRALMGWNRLLDVMQTPDVGAINNHMINWCDGPRLIETEGGYIGRGPMNAMPGDRIFVVRHCERPLVFRDSDAASGLVTLLGPCEVVGLDSGEVDGVEEYETLWVA